MMTLQEGMGMPMAGIETVTQALEEEAMELLVMDTKETATQIEDMVMPMEETETAIQALEGEAMEEDSMLIHQEDMEMVRDKTEVLILSVVSERASVDQFRKTLLSTTEATEEEGKIMDIPKDVNV